MKKFFKKSALAITLAVTMLAGVLQGAQKAKADETEVLTGLSSTEIVSQLGIGWNLGNTFDATGGNKSDIYSQEKSWGNPQVTQELITAVKAAGFDTIRIPVTWYKHISDDGSYTINPEFINRVKEVVDYAYAEDMFVILNIHHEEWVNSKTLDKDYEKIGEELASVWMQLAEAFADYDQHLIFEGMNEPRMAGTSIEWGGNQDGYEAVNYLNQVFVNTVRRSESGYNQERCLMIPGYAASNSENIMESIAIPTVDGEAVNNLIISVHCYSPYNFCLSDNQTTFDPNNSADTADIDRMFSNIQKIFLDKGIPVVVGETSATAKNNVEEREKWAFYMGSKAAAYGVPIVIWDNGSDSNKGGESHAHMDRKNNVVNYPTVIEKLMEGAASVDWGSGRDEAVSGGGSTSLIDGSVIWSNEAGHTSAKQWDYTFIQMGAKSSYYSEGREVAVVYTSANGGEPKMILDSEAKQVWWIQVDPDRIEDVNGKKVAYFSYDKMLSAMNSNGVDNFSELRYMSFLAANDNITAYEISLVGGAPMVTYKVFGADYAVSAEMPEDPSFTNMSFAGWYSTKDYQAGTEYTGGTIDSDITVYAKFTLDLDLDALEQSFEDIRNNPVTEVEPTKAPTPTTAPKDEPTTDKPASTDKPATDSSDDEGGSNTGMIIGIVAAVIVVVGAVIMFIKKKK